MPRPKHDVKLLKVRYYKMKYYELSAVVNGENVRLKRSIFKSRGAAIQYMFAYYSSHYLYGLQVEDSFALNGNKHNVEYVCNDYNRFKVTRHA